MGKRKGVYTVKKGDTLWDIAKKIFHDPEKWKTDLKKEDGSTYTEEEARHIRPGQPIFYEYPQISHKELLTFTNLVNLDWHFVDLMPEQITKKDGKTETQYSTINTILSPKSFVEGYKDPDKKETPIYAYGEGKEGLAEMREKAGIAMEYLEKWEEWQKSDQSEGTDEGKFLGEWEVIYGADNYKVVTDYIDNMYLVATGEKPAPNEVYSTRERLEIEKRNKIIVQAVFEVIGAAADIYLKVGDFKDAADMTTKQILKKACKDFLVDEGIDMAKKMDCFVLDLLLNILKNKDSLIGMIKDILGDTAEDMEEMKVGDRSHISIIDNIAESIVEEIPDEVKTTFTKILGNTSEEITTDIIREVLVEIAGEYKNKDIGYMKDEDIETELNNILENKLSEKLINILIEKKVMIEFTRNLDLNDTGFRVLVLKKGYDIVIVYKGKKVEDTNILPEEIDLLQIVSNRIIRENPDCRILFTGFEGGADLSFINTLIVKDEIQTNSVLFYNNLKEMKGFVDFTYEDIDKDYKSSFKLQVVSELGEISEDLLKEAVCAGIALLFVSSISLLSIGLGFLAIILGGLINVIGKCIKDSMTRSFYNNQLKGLNLITDQNNIKGYITDQFMNNDYISIPYHFYTYFGGVNAANIDLVDTQLIEQVTKKISKPEIGRIITQEAKNDLEKYDLFIVDEKIDEKREKGYGEIKVKKADALLLLKECPDKIRVTDWWDGVIGSSDICHYALECGENEEYEIKNAISEYLSDLRNVTLIDEKIYQEIYKLDVFGIKEPFSYVDGYYISNDNTLSKKYKEKLNECQKLANVMDIIGVMQRSFINKQENVFELIYPEVLDNNPEQNLYNPGNITVKVSSQIPEIFSGNKKDNKNIRVIINEFFFFPYIKKDSGDIVSEDNEKPQLRDEYIASVIKSAILFDYYDMKIILYHNDKIKLMKIKYNSEELEATKNNTVYEYNFVEGNLNNSLHEKISNLESTRIRGYTIPTSFLPYHFVDIINQMSKDITQYEQYYEIKDIVEVERRYLIFFIDPDIDGVLIVNSDYKNKLEYKYNPEDFIVGGELKINAKDLPEKHRSKIKEIKVTNISEEAKYATATNIREIMERTDLPTVEANTDTYKTSDYDLAAGTDLNNKWGEILGENKKTTTDEYMKEIFSPEKYT